ncbi:fungal specific transcription factor domain-containing protein [Aspergillus undulatus]|uniref:fungal specific transcription factor domain-containing protein n=1 Tax=Aspergillus undulatus TaxID=1810928 RepID=UPI003CCDB964
MVMAIGYTSLQRSGKAPRGIEAGFDIPYADIIQRCPWTWSIVGIITRQAMTQRSHPIFGLDRMMAVSVGAMPGLVGDEMDIPFPAITVSRHVIELRQLEAKIMATVHHQRRMAVSALTQTDRSTITARLRSEIEHWYSHGCLISRPELDNVRLHDTMGWLNARYYHLLLILYYPCQFNSGPTANGTARVTALLELVRKFSQYNQVLLSRQQLPLNRVTLSRLFPPCLVLIYCLSWGSNNIIGQRNERRAFIDILDSFPSTWTHARRLSRILAELVHLVSGHEPYPVETTRGEWLRSLRNDMVSLLGETLGKASCYQDLNDYEEQDGGADSDDCESGASQEC